LPAVVVEKKSPIVGRQTGSKPAFDRRNGRWLQSRRGAPVVLEPDLIGADARGRATDAGDSDQIEAPGQVP
jgi:hypothetical protein